MSDKKIMGENMLEHFTLPDEPLSAIFSKQREFGKKFCDLFLLTTPLTGNSKKVEEWKEIFLDCICDELSEVLNWLPWKHWKKYEGFQYNITEIRFELIDILHFIVSIFILFNISPSEIYSYFKVEKGELQKILLQLKGELYSEYQEEITDIKIKDKITRQLFRKMIIKCGVCYCVDNTEDLFRLLREFLKLCALWDMSAKDIYDYYMSKNKENFERQERGY